MFKTSDEDRAIQPAVGGLLQPIIRWRAPCLNQRPIFIIQAWQHAAQKNMVVVTKTETSILNEASQFQFTGFVGAVFPLIEKSEQETRLFIPVKNAKNQVTLAIGVIQAQASSIMPLKFTKQNMAHILSQLQHRPYGWGGLFFYNDCSAEMKSLFAPFGIWLPRNSGAQADLVGTSADLSDKPPAERINQLKRTGHPLLTLIVTARTSS